MNIQHRPSPNYEARPVSTVIDTIIIHYTGMRSADDALQRLCDPVAKVSAHYVIDEEGCVYQLVEDSQRAWHAGLSYWRGKEQLNDMSIGIELVNPGHEFGYRPFPNAQIKSLIALCTQLIARHPIKQHHIIGHSDIAPKRKEDPGEFFNWQHLAEHGIGIWHGISLPPQKPKPLIQKGDSNERVSTMQTQLAKYGYQIPQHGIFDDDTAATVIAFKRRFYPSNLEASWDSVAENMLQNLLART